MHTYIPLIIFSVLIVVITDHISAVMDVAFSPTGREFVSGTSSLCSTWRCYMMIMSTSVSIIVVAT
jgi:WD40 repeat protein